MLEMNGGMGALGKDVPQMVTDLLRLHTWLIIDACEPGGFLAEPDRIGYQEPAYNLTAAERDSCTQDDVNIKKEEPQRDRLQHQQPLPPSTTYAAAAAAAAAQGSFADDWLDYCLLEQSRCRSPRHNPRWRCYLWPLRG